MTLRLPAPIRLSVSVDNQTLLKLQATLQAEENRRISVAEIVRIALKELAKSRGIS